VKYIIATDHAGVDVKEFTKKVLQSKGYEVEDLGPFSSDRVDYPDFAEKLSNRVLEVAGEFDEERDWREKEVFGVLICGTGIGMSITANKVSGIRAALCHDAYTSEMARSHNNANVLCFGARTSGEGTIESMIDAWEKTPFSGGRHLNRVLKINNLDR
jgi:ribose 5-phosphate isomerase B